MPTLTKGGLSLDDRWTLVREAVAIESLPVGPIIVSLDVWTAHRAQLVERGEVGVWLAPADDPAALADDIATLPLIAVDFPQFTDGRGYSIGRLLRERFGFGGELRAIGDVLRDQLYYLHQCGFDAFALRPDQDLESALSGLRDFSDGYQLTNRRLPLFRRRGLDAGPSSGA